MMNVLILGFRTKRIVATIIILAFISCGSNVKGSFKEPQYKIEKLRSKNESSYLILKSYYKDDLSRVLPATYFVNGVIINNRGLEDSITVRVAPGSFSVKTSLFTFNDVILEEVTVERGDSILIDFYLEDFKFEPDYIPGIPNKN